MLLYFTAVIPFSQSGFMCAKIFTQPKETEKKTYSSIQPTQEDQLNETNCQLAFRVSSKYLRVEKHSK